MEASGRPFRTNITPHHTLRSFGESDMYIPSGAEYFKLALRKSAEKTTAWEGTIQLDEQVLAAGSRREGNGWTRHGSWLCWCWR